MIADDTKVVVRLLVADDPAQSRRASALRENAAVWIGATVLLENAWVLDAAEQGIDLTDAFHLALAQQEGSAFDRKIRRRGNTLREVRLA